MKCSSSLCKHFSAEAWQCRQNTHSLTVNFQETVSAYIPHMVFTYLQIWQKKEEGARFVGLQPS